MSQPFLSVKLQSGTSSEVTAEHVLYIVFPIFMLILFEYGKCLFYDSQLNGVPVIPTGNLEVEQTLRGLVPAEHQAINTFSFACSQRLSNSLCSLVEAVCWLPFAPRGHLFSSLTSLFIAFFIIHHDEICFTGSMSQNV